MTSFNEWVNLKEWPNWLNMASKALGYQAPPQKKVVGFKTADFDNVKTALTDYLGMISRYLNFVINQVNATNSRIGPGAASSFERMVAPAYANLKQWVSWIKDMNSQVREETFYIEAIKINYRAFEKLKSAMQTLVTAMRNWVQLISSHVQPEQAKRFQAVYDKNVVAKQGIMANQLLWLDRKLQQVMQQNNIPYQGIQTR